jgi:phospholipid transport system substrate-binding protein
MPQPPLKRLAVYCSRVALLVAALAVLPLSVRAQSASDAQSFVQTGAQKAIAILQDKSSAPDARREHIHAFLLSLVDTQRIASYTLGPAQETASPADIAAYSDAFRDFAVIGYDAMLGSYGGETLHVTGAVQHGPGDFVVTAEIIDPSGAANGKTPSEVDFRILEKNGKFLVADVNVGGVWLALAERNDVQGFLKQHNGDMAALIAHIKSMAAAMRQNVSTG